MAGGERTAEWVEQWDKWRPERASLSSLQGVCLSAELISFETWMDSCQGGRREGGAALFGAGRVREHAASRTRIWRDEFAPKGLSASFQTSLSPLCYSVRTHFSAGPPTSKNTRRVGKARGTWNVWNAHINNCSCGDNSAWLRSKIYNVVESCSRWTLNFGKIPLLG